MKALIVVLVLCLGVIIFVPIFAPKVNTTEFEKIYISDIQITHEGIVILSCDEIVDKQKKSFVLVLKHDEIEGRIYVGNVKYKRKINNRMFKYQYIFVDNN